MNDEQSWRVLLKHMISDPKERQRIAEISGINPVTLVRWAKGTSNPRRENLQPFLDAFPEYNEQLIASLAKEYPHFFAHNGSTEHSLEIPSAFYDQVLQIYTTVPPIIRKPSMCSLILQQIVDHLDTHHLGMAAAMIECVPPTDGKIVRSLRTTLGRGTEPWPHQMEHQTLFLGAESQAGYTVIFGHSSIIQTPQEKLRMFPTHHVPCEGSAVTIPLLLTHYTPGCLYVTCTQANYFSVQRLDLIQRYAHLLILAFDQFDSYALQHIKLGIMPPFQEQQALLTSFQKRVSNVMIQSIRNHQPLLRSQAEALAWNEIEQQLLQLSLRQKNYR